MKWLVVATPSPFRNYLISAIPATDILAVIYESGKDISVDFETKVDFESNLYSRFNLSRDANIEYYKTINVNSSNCFELIDSIVKCNPKEKVNILLTGANWIRKPQLELISGIDCVNQVLNVHFGDCLNYRGLDSNLWAFYHRDNSSLGVSIHLVETMLDTGDRVIFTPLPSPTSYGHLLESQVESAFIAISELIKTTSSLIYADHLTNNGLGRYYGLMPAVLKKHIYRRFH